MIIFILEKIAPNYTVSLQNFAQAQKLLHVVYTFIIIV